MAHTLIEAASASALAAFQQTQAFLAYVSARSLRGGPAKLDSGVQAPAHGEQASPDSAPHWLLIEDDSPEDNATFRLNAQGECEFWATGVEV